MTKQNHMSKSRTTPNENLNDRIKVRTTVCLPKSVLDQVKAKAQKNKTTVRREVLRGLRRLGYDVPEIEMVKDARRGNFTRVKRT